MVRAELKDIASLGVEPLESFAPEDPTRFEIWVTLSIGLEGLEAADDFQALICSTRSLAAMVEQSGVLVGQPLIVVEAWDLPLIKRRIEDYCAACQGEEWEDILPMLTRLGLWEFENYNPDTKVTEH
jgi:Immunity protein 8